MYEKIDIEEIKKLVIERLKPLNPEKVILFGSFVYGNPTKDSDIDLYIVTKDDFIPKSYDEKWELVKKIYEALRDLRRVFPMDLIIHTKAMHKKFVKLNSSFAREINKKGLVFYGE